MKLLYWNKALAWKEWRQNSLRFWGLFIIMSLTPVFSAIFTLALGALYPEAWFNGGAYHANTWSEGIALMVNSGDNWIMRTLVPILIMVLAVLIVAEERSNNSLEFLLATPVSRREVLSTKFLLGAGVITAIMVFEFLFMLGLNICLPAKYSIGAAGEWFLLTTSVYLAIFALALLAASITGNFRTALFAAIIFIYFPRILAEILGELFAAFDLYPGMFLIPYRETLAFWANHLTLPYYLDHYCYGQLNVWAVLLIILAAIIFYRLAIRFFEHNQQERNGQALMLANSAQILKVGTSILLAALSAIILAGILQIKGWPILLFFVLVYFLVSALFAFVYRYGDTT
jgi:ABC-type transport system involved in multi-copper enzyme maturation permease subunit